MVHDSNTGFKKVNISRMIDSKILKSIDNENESFLEIIKSLEEKVLKFSSIMSKNYDIKVLEQATFMFKNCQYSSIEPKALRYNIIFQGHCTQRINDIKWIIKNRYKFSKLDNVKTYNLILLRDKLKENEKI